MHPRSGSPTPSVVSTTTPVVSHQATQTPSSPQSSSTIQPLPSPKHQPSFQPPPLIDPHIPPLINPHIVHPHIPIMAARYAPLVLQAPFANMPQDYQTRIPQFDGTRPITAQQQVDRMNDNFDLQEVDEENVKMRLLAQSLIG